MGVDYGVVVIFMFTEEELANEEWRPVVGWEQWYEVSDLGRARSVDRVVTYSNGVSRETKGQLLKVKTNRGGNVYVTLCKDGVCKCIRLDQLVAQAFVQRDEDDELVYHLNEDKGDCRATNLTWVPLGVDIYDYLNLSCADVPSGEEWRPVVGWEALYEISDLGQLRSVTKRVTGKNGVDYTVSGRLLSLSTHGDRYIYAVLKHNGVQKTAAIHNLVAEAFLPNPNNYHIVHHKNGDKLDNRAANLMWMPSGAELAKRLPSYESQAGDGEEWRPVVGWEDYYEVSSLGGVRSLPRVLTRVDGAVVTYPGKSMSQKPDSLGYVTITLSANGIHKGVKVHRLVAEAFIPNPESLPEVDHLNGVRNDNRVDNLVWATRKDNCRNRVLDGSRAIVRPYDGVSKVYDLLPGEEWRDIEGYEGLYKISSFGRVLSVPRPRSSGGIRRASICNSGYLSVALCKDGIKKTLMVHRLVAKAFIPNPLGLKEVNHRDECKTNNNVSNLEWCSREYNQSYGTRIARSVASHDYNASSKKAASNHDYKAIGLKRRKPVLQFDLDGELVRCWSGLCEIREKLGFGTGGIYCACRRKGYGKYKQGIAYGFKWFYEEDYGKTA